MGQALYRNYRPRTFAEVVGQEPITETLGKAIKSGRINHAYLLTGPKGVGKTSVARIIAHEINKLPYKDESLHLDIIEIDAASNRRIDEIRDIREKVHITPTSAKYKVYIIDEVHMLTKEAFNALLKTLEEPPAHCIFILATTEAHKLPETIISRTQRFSFKPVEKDKAVAHLKKIAKKEKIDIEPAALELLAEHGEGSFRDSISLLDQLSNLGRIITQQDVRQLLGWPPTDAVSKLIEHINNRDKAAVLSLLADLRNDDNNPASVASQLNKKLRSELLAHDGQHYSWAPTLMKKLLDINPSRQPYELLEISLLESIMENNSPGPAAIPQGKAPANLPVVEKPPVYNEPVTKILKSRSDNNFNLDLWPEVLDEIKKRAASIYTALRLAEPEINDSTLTLAFQFPLHKNKLQQSRHIKLISDVISELSGAELTVKCTLSAKTLKKSDVRKTEKTSVEAPKLTAISNIFGSAEVIE